MNMKTAHRGFAQQLFQPAASSPPPWTTLYDALDHRLAQALQKALGDESESSHAILCHLSAAVQQGHLCLRVTPSTLSPSVEDLFGAADPNHVAAIQSLIENGIESLVGRIDETHPYLHYDKDRLYFQRHWVAESQFIEQIQRLQATQPTASIDPTTLAAQVTQLTQAGLLQPEQATAILTVGQHALTVITGGPGTGKTYTAGQCLHALWQALSPEQRSHFHISVAAPTGKAAATLMSSIQRFVNTLDGFPKLKGQTLHKLLNLQSSAASASPLSSDLILIDECSMIDAQLFAQLLAAVKPGARLILMGDAEQLPAVEAGGLFADLVQALAQSSCLARLTVCRRAESPVILNLASAVQRADWSQVQTILNHGQEVQQRIFTGTLAHQHQQLVRETLVHYRFKEHALLDAQKLKQSLTAFRMLSPLRKGPWGVETINALFRDASFSAGMHIAPIMITKNDDSQSLFNGDIGLLVNASNGNAYAVFLQGDTVRRLSASRLPPYEFAYCLSVHKSQGSEFQHVFLIVPSGSEHFGRQLFYTAATRARRQLDIAATDDIIQRMLQQSSTRMSGVIDRMSLKQSFYM